MVSSTGHVPDNHVGYRQDLTVFCFFYEDGNSAGNQLTVVLYPLCPCNELSVGVVPCHGSERERSSDSWRNDATRKVQG